MPPASTNPSQFLSEVFRLFDGSDVTKKTKFILSGITTGNTRELTIPDENGVIALVGHSHEAGVVTFLGLTDTPASYDSEDIGRILKVKDDLSGLEFTDFNADNWDTAFGWGDHLGLYDAAGTAAGTMTTHLGNFTHGDISHANRTELDKLTDGDHDVISSGNPHSVTPTELSLVIGTHVQAQGAVLDDLNTLGANAADSEFLVGTSAGVLTWESGNTARTSLGLGTGDSPQFTALTVNQGTIFNSPGADTAIATKGYVDSLGGGGSTFWASVAVATITNVDLSNGLENGDEIDGWTLVTGDRVLVKDQTDATENGLYVAVASGAASRATDADSADEIVGRKCIIFHGDTNYGQLFFCTSSPITLGVTEIEFQSLAGGGDYGSVELLGEEVESVGEWELPLTADDIDTGWETEMSLPAGQAIGWHEGSFGDPIEFGWGDTPKAISKFKITGEHANLGDSYIRIYYYENGWVYVGEVDLTSSVDTYEFDLGTVIHPTKWKLENKTNGSTPNYATYIYDIQHWISTVTEQHKITLEAYRPALDYTITFPNDEGAANEVMIGNGSGVLSWGGHDDLSDFAANEHFLQTAITNVSTSLSTGLLKVTTGTGALTVVADASDNWNTAHGWGDHSGLYDAAGTAASTMTTHLGNFAHGDIATNKAHTDTTHDYAYISGNDGTTGITAAELEELSNGSETTLHSHAGGAVTFLDLTDTPVSYDSADIGKYVKVKDDLSGLEFDTPIVSAHTIASHSDTTGTGVELEELTDGSQTTLHSHAGGEGVDTFLELTDTPAGYDSADIGKFVRVKSDLSGLEFAECVGGAVTFLDLTDTPDSIDSADLGMLIRVKDDLSGLEFTDAIHIEADDDVVLTGNLGVGKSPSLAKIDIEGVYYCGLMYKNTADDGYSQCAFRNDLDEQMYMGISGSAVAGTFADLAYVNAPTGHGLALCIGGAPKLKVASDGVIYIEETLKIKERAAAAADTEAYAQVYARNDAPNTLWFADDTGVEHQLGGYSSRCRVGLNGDQTLGSGSTDIMEFDDEDFDDNNEWDSVNFKFVATDAGRYLIAWDIYCDALGSDGTTYIFGYIFKNNVQQSSKAYYPEADPMSGYVGGFDVLELAASDYIQIKARQNRGVNKTLTAFTPNKLNWVAIHRLS